MPVSWSDGVAFGYLNTIWLWHGGSPHHKASHPTLLVPTYPEFLRHLTVMSVSIGTLFPTRNKNYKFQTTAQVPMMYVFSSFFIRTIGQKYRVKQVSRLARLSWAGKQFVVNEGYWGLQDDMPGH